MLPKVIGFVFVFPIIVLLTVFGWTRVSVGWGAFSLVVGAIYWYVLCLNNHDGKLLGRFEGLDGSTDYYFENGIMRAYTVLGFISTACLILTTIADYYFLHC